MSSEILVEKNKIRAETGLPYIAVAETEYLTLRAKVTISMLERWGMVAAQPDGEDSVGRAKLKLVSPDDLVERACSVVDKAFDEFKARGWIVEMPSYEDVRSKFEGKENATI